MKNSKKPKKFNCSDIEKMLHAFLDQQLSSDQLKLFKEHLEYCLPCDKKVEFEIKLKKIIQLKATEHTYPVALEHELKKLISSSE